jgi:hypothetical protein
MNRSGSPLITLSIFCILIGASLDFTFNGVFKIIWIIVYGPAYIAASKILTTQLSKTKWASNSSLAVGSFFAGALAMHLFFTGYSRHVSYHVSLTSMDPVTFHSDQWPQRLIVVSPTLSSKLVGMKSVQDVEVEIIRTVDYGCTRLFRVESIAGVDFLKDPESRWTWKTDPHFPGPIPRVGPGYEDEGLPWCRIHFY